MLVRSEHLAVLVVIPLATLALGLFLSRTRYGLAIRASAANPDAARLASISIKRMSTLVWVLVGTLATLAAIISAPLTTTSAGELFTIGPASPAAGAHRRAGRPHVVAPGGDGGRGGDRVDRVRAHLQQRRARAARRGPVRGGARRAAGHGARQPRRRRLQRRVVALPARPTRPRRSRSGSSGCGASPSSAGCSSRSSRCSRWSCSTRRRSSSSGAASCSTPWSRSPSPCSPAGPGSCHSASSPSSGSAR